MSKVLEVLNLKAHLLVVWIAATGNTGSEKRGIAWSGLLLATGVDGVRWRPKLSILSKIGRQNIMMRPFSRHAPGESLCFWAVNLKFEGCRHRWNFVSREVLNFEFRPWRSSRVLATSSALKGCGLYSET